MAANTAASMRRKHNKRLKMAAEHKGNKGEIFYFPVFCNFYSNCHFPLLKNYTRGTFQQVPTRRIR